MGFDGAQAFSRVLASHGGGQLKSLCGIAPNATMLEVPRREIDKVDAVIFAAELENTQWAESLGNETNQNKRTAKLMRKGRVDGTSSWSPLIWAAKDGNNGLIEAMLSRSANIDMQASKQAAPAKPFPSPPPHRTYCV